MYPTIFAVHAFDNDLGWELCLALDQLINTTDLSPFSIQARQHVLWIREFFSLLSKELSS